ncbi:zinc finger FYVE domain-containing protein 9 [Latimeria chalumnae]|uniref:Zinc finger FYVE domain-containing protein n=2 Tax=Latimeria chalumnae TaxID=7897 RepID=H3ASV5_LATCH|nr:PREDICTED: zinc finger FYVE domain-containing protein 9 [Latimeria chalumnae]XP_006005067.1 PREDICTED: zinc finger FYVE domain-containing protein 9 [Latimeria chalumnae]XP_014349382.1 PREDICTED: zinc finger FYVE domain-containing protein 9 [Latimeria chalumnae]XP_014349383.1 PREDICTED: zinc finger FYVE domain-containing protein 9 [Latimeria chalumnae]XP_014349384.1 PREDICTED: zinc finger FYVE domain-containing protein 9 [Latimeria chalumnae]XP_014349385.1 PREDICTED: zinc finger FYVE domain-|eukprot:XP_006005066.1 PREDICTED: zinc finger FYVE domain-containing protein 9 [Latimeria chalumnae]
MENYFQAEAYNLDRVLDEFEQNEDEAGSPTRSDAKWNQILDPPSHLLSLNPALANVNKVSFSNETSPIIKSFALSHSDITVKGGGDHCPHGKDCAVNLETCASPWIDNQVATEVHLANDDTNHDAWPISESPERTTCENVVCLPEEINHLVGAIMRNCDKRTLQNEGLLDCNNSNSQPLSDISSFKQESENGQNCQLDASMNGFTEHTAVNVNQGVHLNKLFLEEASVNHLSATLSDNVTSGSPPTDSKDALNAFEKKQLSKCDTTGFNELSPSQATADSALVTMEDTSVAGKRLTITASPHGTDPEAGGMCNIPRTGSAGGIVDVSSEMQTDNLIQSQVPVTSVCNIAESEDHNGHFSEHFVSDDEMTAENQVVDHSLMETEGVLNETESLSLDERTSLQPEEMTTKGGDVQLNRISNTQGLREDEELLQPKLQKQSGTSTGENITVSKVSIDPVEPHADYMTGPNFSAMEGSSPAHSLSNGFDSDTMQSPTVTHVSKIIPSKEDSVTEEKELEESKLDTLVSTDDQLRGSDVIEDGVSANADQMKNAYLNNLSGPVSPVLGQTAPQALNNEQPVSIPFGGARPKLPTHLKLQIPKPFSSQLQNDLTSVGSNAKNKNVDLSGRVNVAQNLTDTFQEESLLPWPVSNNGENLGGYEVDLSSNSCLTIASESPDNDLRAGQFAVLSKKPFTTLGEVAPVWVPDSQAPNCMKCEAKFTFTKRRHHCRACGKVFCAACCSLKCKLTYMDKKEARVCVICHSVLMNAQAWENMMSASSQSPNPNNPAEYCSTIPPLQQAQASGALSSPPPTVLVPVGVLKHPGMEVTQPREQRRVWFADGILPNGEVADSAKLAATGPSPAGPLAVSHDPIKPTIASSASTETINSSTSSGSITQVGSPVGNSINLIPEDGLPPILILTGVKGDYAVEERPSQISVMQQLEDGGPDPLVFVLNANLLAMVKIVNYVNRKCWSFSTKGMHAVGQSEIIILLQCLPDEKCIPKDIFNHFVQLYQDALAGNVVENLGHFFFTQSFLGSKEHGGFLYIAPTYQSLQDLVLPNPPYLFGVLIQKWETPWAKVFPIRLMLRLGAEYRFYPCPLFSVRFRKPLFGETGHTIMNLLADFRNYQYTLPVVQGQVVDMEVRKTSIKIPSNRYNEMMKAMNKSNEHVLAIGACFNEKADSHLVCVQNDDGNYQTQAISIHNQPRKVTGACFFVFSGALKSSSGYLAKSSIVEDGIMVQITAENMDSLRQALREMKDFTITCGKADAEEPQELVHIQWVEDDRNFNKGVVSPIDGKSMESITSVKIFHGSEFKANGKVIRWSEVFFLQSDDHISGLSDPADHSRLTENVAKAFCLALCPHLKLLKEDGMTKLGLRVTLDSDQVGYQAGSNGQPLPSQYMNDLDSALVPVIHGGACQLSEGPIVMELIFYILENVS